MKTNYVYDDDHVTITTGDIETHIETHGCEDDVVTIAWCELAAGIGLLHDQIIHQRETLDKLPKCWALRDGKLVQDCPVVPGMELWFVGDDGPDDEAITINRLSYFSGAWLANDEFVESWCLDLEAAEALALQWSDYEQNP